MRKWIVAVFVLTLGLPPRRQWRTTVTGRRCSPSRRWGGSALYRGGESHSRYPRGGAAWRIDKAHGILRADGDLEIRVEGLVLTSTGTNPQPAFRAVVSCLSIESGSAVTTNLVTAPFPATTAGDASFDGSVSLPSPCLAPIVFVTTGAGDPPRWFSVTGA